MIFFAQFAILSVDFNQLFFWYIFRHYLDIPLNLYQTCQCQWKCIFTSPEALRWSSPATCLLCLTVSISLLKAEDNLNMYVRWCITFEGDSKPHNSYVILKAFINYQYPVCEIIGISNGVLCFSWSLRNKRGYWNIFQLSSPTTHLCPLLAKYCLFVVFIHEFFQNGLITISENCTIAFNNIN